MATPKLAMIPTAYKAGKLYSVLPQSGVGDFTFARASAATRVNEDGLIETMGNNIPRLDYTDGGCPNFLLEPQRTNLIPYSSDFSNAAWVKQNVTITPNNYISPSGETTASTIFESNFFGNHFIYDTITSTPNVLYNFSIFVKKNNRRYIGIQGFYSSVRGNIAFYDLDNGTLVYTFSEGDGYGIYDAKIENYGNGWYRLSANFIAPDIEIYMGICLADNKWVTGTAYDNQYQGDVTKGVYIYGAQLEQGSYPTSYIPTNGSTVTRVGETCNGSGDAATFNDSEGVLMAEISALDGAGGGTRRVEVSNAVAASQYVRLQIANGDGSLYAIVNNGSQQFLFNATSFNATLSNKIILKYKQNDFSLFLNGFEVGSSNVGNTFANGVLTQVNFSSTNSEFYGKTKQIQYFDSALTDAELETLTSWTSFLEMANGQNYTII